MTAQDRVMNGAWLAVRVAGAMNRLFLAAVMLGGGLTLALPLHFSTLVGKILPSTDVAQAVAGAHWLMLLGIVMALVTDRLLAVLLAMIESAQEGDPFIAVNARRLEQIGWCLLLLQLCEFPGGLIARHFPAMGSAAPSGDLSVGGWISVLMVFALAQVFRTGAAMRDELDGTV